MPAVDVICAAHQSAATIGETLASVAAQTLAPGRVIVVDDGSSDSTGDIAAATGAEVIRQARAGVAVAQNTAIAASRAPWLAFIDADDLWPRGKLALQVSLMLGGERPDGVLGLVESFLCPSLTQEECRLFRLPPHPQPAWLTGALMIRRTSFDRVGPFDPGLAAGHAIDWFDRARHAGLIFAMPEAVVLHRRVRAGSLSGRSAGRDAAYVDVARRAIARRRAG